MMVSNCCRNSSEADDGYAFGGKRRPLLQRGGYGWAAALPTRSAPGVHQFFGAGPIEWEVGTSRTSATIRPSTAAVLTNLICKPARGHAITILSPARGKTVLRCDSTCCRP